MSSRWQMFSAPPPRTLLLAEVSLPVPTNLVQPSKTGTDAALLHLQLLLSEELTGKGNGILIIIFTSLLREIRLGRRGRPGQGSW